MTDSNPRFLRKKTATKLILIAWTEILAKRQDMYECDREGNPLKGVDPSADELSAVQLELDQLQTSIDGMTAIAHQAALDERDNQIVELEAEIEAKIEIIGALRSEISMLKVEPTPLEKLDEFLPTLDGMDGAGAKDALEAFVQQSFGVDLDKRANLGKMIEAARAAASAA